MTLFAERSTTDAIAVGYEATVPKLSSGCGCGAGDGGCDCGGCDLVGDAAGLERTRYYPRQIVTSDDLTQDQIYFRDRLRRHNRFLHGWGIACGLTVGPCGADDRESTSCKVKVSAGYALDPYGNEIVVGANQVLDLCKEDIDGNLACVPQTDPWCHPVDAVRRPGSYYLAIRWMEEAVKPVHAATGCSCRESTCENSRIRDGYEFKLLADRPAHYDRSCERLRNPCLGIDVCPPCPESGWIILATVAVDGATVTDLDRDGRQYLLSTARQCLTCPDESGQMTNSMAWVEAQYVAAMAEQADSMLVANAVINERPSRVAIAVDRDQIVGATALEVKELMDQVMVFDVDDPTTRPFRAGLLMAHSNLNGASVLDGPEDLAARIGVPVIDVEGYEEKLTKVDGLLDESGRREFRQAMLGNVSRVGELDVAVLAQVAKVNATKLRSRGISTLADLGAAKELPKLSTGAADRRVEAAREFLRTRSGAIGIRR